MVPACDEAAEPKGLQLPVLALKAVVLPCESPCTAVEPHVVPLPAFCSQADAANEAKNASINELPCAAVEPHVLPLPAFCSQPDASNEAKNASIEQVNLPALMPLADGTSSERRDMATMTDIQNMEEFWQLDAGVQTDDGPLEAELGDLTRETYRLRAQLLGLGIKPWQSKTRRPVTLGLTGNV